MRNLIRRFKEFFFGSDHTGTRAKWMGDEPTSGSSYSPASRSKAFAKYKPDAEFEDVREPVENPIIGLLHDVMNDKAHVTEAYLFEGNFDKDWKLREAPAGERPYRISHVKGDIEFKQKVKESGKAQERREMRESILKKNDTVEAMAIMRSKKLLENFSNDSNSTSTGSFDTGQYTEFTPLFGGPYYKQLYLYDMLTMHARAFEAKNHNPLAKRIIDLLAQYSFGRRFKWRIKDKAKEKAWNDHAQKINLIQRVAKFWVPEYLTFGELFYDKKSHNSVDPSSIWDIITDPDDITKVYYYYQCYSTPFTQFTGYNVAGVPAAGAKVKSTEYRVVQIPFDQILHMKRNVTSYEKRGRSTLYPILGWLKRYKDLMDAEVVRAQLAATFAWDVEINGSQSDVDGFMSSESDALGTGKTFYHNQQVKRAPMAALPSSSSVGSGGLASELLAFIATGIGIPKDYFNIMGGGGGNRATALVGAEPFTKLVEDIQADFEHFLLEMASIVIPDYQEGDIEFIFPSVTKDTTTETVANIVTGKSEGFIDDQTAAEMYAAEVNITGYDYDEVKARKQEQARENPVPSIMPDPSAPPPIDTTPIHGQGKQNIKKAMNTL